MAYSAHRFSKYKLGKQTAQGVLTVFLSMGDVTDAGVVGVTRTAPAQQYLVLPQANGAKESNHIVRPGGAADGFLGVEGFELGRRAGFSVEDVAALPTGSLY